jgi:hypothetical protein
VEEITDPTPETVIVFTVEVSIVIVTVADPPTIPTLFVESYIELHDAVGAALAGETAENSPKPKAETATSAMRLRVVFVDICFLSLVDPGAFPRSAWQRKELSAS